VKDKERNRPQSADCLIVEVVELNQGCAVAARSDDDVVLLFSGSLEHVG
jgi:hypothetical protein